MKYELKLENPKEFYCMEHRPSHFLHFGVSFPFFFCVLLLVIDGSLAQAVEAELADLGTDREDLFT